MPALATDTHSIIWFLSRDPRLSSSALEALRSATQEGAEIFVPSICLVEMTYLVEKRRIPAIARERVIAAIDDSSTRCELVSLDREIAEILATVSRDEVPDLPDRVISATALALGVPLVSADRRIRSSRVETIW